MVKIADKKGRRGRAMSARERRHAKRSAGISPDVIRGGLSGGKFKPLSEHDLQQIHQTALQVLANIGLGNPSAEILEHALPKGALLSDDNRLCFPQSLMEDLINISCKEFTHFGATESQDIQAGGEKVYFRTCGEAVSVLEYQTRETRPSTLVDLYDFVRLADKLDNIHGYAQTVIATELSEQVYEHDINVLYALAAGTQKPLAMSTATASHIDDFIAMMDMIMGGEGEYIKRPRIYFGGCPIVSPLRFGTENAEVLVKCAELGIPYDIAVASQAGATAPAALAGALVQTFAETLGALATMNLISPGTPFFMGHWPFISDLRTGSFTGGSGEQALVSSAIAQLCNFYGLPSSVSACMSDSKIPDNQAGYEKAITACLVAHAGCNYIGESAGMLGSLMACSFESMIIDNDMIGNIMRTIKGIEVNEETLSYDVIKSSVFGEGHFLNQDQTLELMEKEYHYPDLADRSVTGEWEQMGKKDIFDRAHERARQILSEHYPVYINPEIDKQIRERFPIKLSLNDMQKGAERWL